MDRTIKPRTLNGLMLCEYMRCARPWLPVTTAVGTILSPHTGKRGRRPLQSWVEMQPLTKRRGVLIPTTAAAF